MFFICNLDRIYGKNAPAKGIIQTKLISANTTTISKLLHLLFGFEVVDEFEECSSEIVKRGIFVGRMFAELSVEVRLVFSNKDNSGNSCSGGVDFIALFGNLEAVA